MQYTWDVVTRLRPTLVAALVIFIVLSFPDQIFELYLINIDAWRELSWFTLAISQLVPLAIFALLTVVLWWGSVHLLSLSPPLNLQSRRHVILADALVVVIALAPAIAIVAGLGNARAHIVTAGELSEDALGASVAAYRWSLIICLPPLALVIARATRRACGSGTWRDIFSLRASAAVLITLFGFILALVQWPSQLPRALGGLTVLLIFFLMFTWILVFFSTVYRRTGFPVTVAVLLAAMLFSWRGWNDNHRVEYQYRSGTQSASLEASFAAWFAERKDRSYFEDRKKPYPVYVIAAEGGGIYAGYHLASFLARMQQQCPMFAQHVFAISSVSGGSLGAAYFAAQVNRDIKNSSWQACNANPVEGPLTQKTAAFFSKDFLSPLLAATLFPDLAQRLLPFPIPSFDRASSLERAFAEGWGTTRESTKDQNPFNKTLDELWSTSGATPLLVLNATNVNTGSRLIFSSVLINTSPTAMHVAEALCARSPKAITLPLVSAVSLSARFPWVTPAGWLERPPARAAECAGSAVHDGWHPPDRNRLYLADGGYFENSGLETASELVRRLRSYAADCAADAARKASTKDDCGAGFALPVEIRMIMVFTMDDFFRRMLGEDTELSASGAGELYTPLKTLLNTRSARTNAVHAREWLFDDNVHLKTPSNFYAILNSPLRYGTYGLHQVMLDGTKFFLPLGWRLSSRSIRAIANNQDGSARTTAEMIKKELMAE